MKEYSVETRTGYYSHIKDLRGFLASEAFKANHGGETVAICEHVPHGVKLIRTHKVRKATPC